MTVVPPRGPSKDYLKTLFLFISFFFSRVEVVKKIPKALFSHYMLPLSWIGERLLVLMTGHLVAISVAAAAGGPAVCWAERSTVSGIT